MREALGTFLTVGVFSAVFDSIGIWETAQTIGVQVEIFNTLQTQVLINRVLQAVINGIVESLNTSRREGLVLSIVLQSTFSAEKVIIFEIVLYIVL
ncbi:MAG: hypothetical protein DHS20C13_29450 [Thermodesulfobacteriota bacterium]|nr:MAG: hypothetical protein DHS20C13_29450 [Thermodesulfobacteriota bacterium]